MTWPSVVYTKLTIILQSRAVCIHPSVIPIVHNGHEFVNVSEVSTTICTKILLDVVLGMK